MPCSLKNPSVLPRAHMLESGITWPFWIKSSPSPSYILFAFLLIHCAAASLVFFQFLWGIIKLFWTSEPFHMRFFCIDILFPSYSPFELQLKYHWPSTPTSLRFSLLYIALCTFLLPFLLTLVNIYLSVRLLRSRFPNRWQILRR